MRLCHIYLPAYTYSRAALMRAAPTFASAAPSDTLPDTARLATLQDATKPHLNLGSVLAANAVALLVDGSRAPMGNLLQGRLLI